MCLEVAGETGTIYQIEINVVWDDDAKTSRRFVARLTTAEFGAWLNWKPLVQDFLGFPDERTE